MIVTTLRQVADTLDFAENRKTPIIPALVRHLRIAAATIERLESENTALCVQQEPPKEPMILDDLRQLEGGPVNVYIDLVHCIECRHKDSTLCRCRRRSKFNNRTQTWGYETWMESDGFCNIAERRHKNEGSGK